MWRSNSPCGTMIPRQFGPITRIVPRRTSIYFSNDTPTLPHSLKPTEITTAPATPALAHSPMTSGTVVAGVATIARSTGLRHAVDGRVSSDTEHPMTFWVDGIDRTSEPACSKVLENGSSHTAGFFSRTNQGDCFGSKNPFERQCRMPKKLFTAADFGLCLRTHIQLRWASGCHRTAEG